jgi:hypothetical protein
LVDWQEKLNGNRFPEGELRMINILFIAFEFPPLNRGGVHRSLAFVKFLPQFGDKPIVITLDEESYEKVFNEYGQDPQLGEPTRLQSAIVSLPSESPMAKSRLEEFATIYFSLHGNETRRWKKVFFEALPRLIEQYRPKAIFATLPPFGILKLASEASRRYNLPLILDFRDAWSQWRTVPFGTRIHYWFNLRLERKYLKRAAAVVATSQQTLEDFRSLHPSVPGSRFHYIPNGYEGDLQAWTPIDVNKRIFLIGYVGSFYYSPEARKQMLAEWWQKRGHRMLQYIPQKQDWLYRSPYYFFKALHWIRQNQPVVSDKIKVQFVGKIPSWLQAMIREFGLESQVDLLGEKPHKEALHFQQNCDLLLITSARKIGGRDYSIAGKTFEYIQAQKPILSFTCEGAQRDILEKTGMALTCDPDQTETSGQQIVRLLKGELILRPDYPIIEGLSRMRLSEDLSDLIFQLTGEKKIETGVQVSRQSTVSHK